MPNNASNKGARGEREVVEIFDAGGFNQAQRARAGAVNDRGDLAGVHDLTIEVKNYNDIAKAVTIGMAELEKEKINNKTRWGVLCVKRKYKGWVAVIPLHEFVALYAVVARPGGERHPLPEVQKPHPRGIVRIQAERKAARLEAERLAVEAAGGRR